MVQSQIAPVWYILKESHVLSHWITMLISLIFFSILYVLVTSQRLRNAVINFGETFTGKLNVVASSYAIAKTYGFSTFSHSLFCMRLSICWSFVGISGRSKNARIPQKSSCFQGKRSIIRSHITESGFKFLYHYPFKC